MDGKIIDDVTKLLKNNKLEHLIEIFQEHEISGETLGLLLEYPTEFKNIVPNLGDRLKLRQIFGDSTKSVETILPEEVIIIQGEQSGTLLDVTNTIAESPRPSTSTDISYLIDDPFLVTNSFASTPKRPRIHESNHYNSNIKVDLRSILSQSLTGKAIEAFYKTSGELDSRCQSYLCDLIVQYFLNQEDFIRLVNADFEYIAAQIVDFFPNEVKEVYYVAPIRKSVSKDKKPGVSRGKLVDKYRNKISFLRKAKIVPSLRDTEEDFHASESKPVDNPLQDDITWLRNNIEPWDEIKRRWTLTFPLRSEIFQKDSNGLKELIENFPVLKNPSAPMLLEEDFRILYPNCAGKIFDSFEDKFKLLLGIKRKTLDSNENLLLEILETGNLNSVSRHFFMISLLVALLPARPKKQGKHWVPTKDECKESIIIHVKLPGDINTAIENKRKKYVKLNLPIQPFIIVEGPSYSDLRNIFVSFLDILYPVHTILKALDICFIVTHIFNLNYPIESQHVWLFIQLGVYDLHTKFDNIPGIIDLVNKVNKRAANQ